MQRTVEPEWRNKRLVAIKQFNRKKFGSWTECQNLREIKVLRALPSHPNIIPFYDAFLHSPSHELYLIFEPMEGNLYHLFKQRKRRSVPLAGGLVASIFHQIASALSHLHNNDYFHRDLKPENILVTTTGYSDYNTISLMAPPDAAKEKDVIVLIKLADFGLTRETKSNPPYTEYINTRWYRAPETILPSSTYSSAVDNWGLGVILAEALNLRPLFPGTDQIDQVAKICAVLGDPSDEYGFDSSGIEIGGGPWPDGITLANAVGFQFPKNPPLRNFASLFEPRVLPTSLLDDIRGLLKYDPQRRLTSQKCLERPFLKNMEAPLP